MLTSDLKLSLIRQIDSLPDDWLPEVQAKIDELLAKEERRLAYEKRLQELTELASHLEEKEDFEAYFREFEESRKDRPLPFRED
ncbi:MAG: hypothetical protein AAB316_21475 [Bacteroidota bacterium]